MEVLSLSHPIGTYSVVLDREELLQLDDRGGLLLVVQRGARRNSQAARPDVGGDLADRITAIGSGRNRTR